MLIIKKNIAKRRVYLYGAAALFIGSITVMSVIVGTRSLHERLVLASPVKTVNTDDKEVADPVVSEAPRVGTTVRSSSSSVTMKDSTSTAASTSGDSSTATPTPSESPSPTPSASPTPDPTPTPTPSTEPTPDPVAE